MRRTVEDWQQEWESNKINQKKSLQNSTQRVLSSIKLYTPEEISSFFEMLGSPKGLTVDEMIKYASSPGLPYCVYPDWKQKWNFAFEKNSSNKESIWGIFARNTIAGTSTEWLRDVSGEIVSFENIESAKIYALSYILNIIRFESSFEETAKDVKTKRLEKLGRKFRL